MRARSRRWLAGGGALLVHGAALWLHADADDVQVVKPHVQWLAAVDVEAAAIEVVLRAPPAQPHSQPQRQPQPPPASAEPVVPPSSAEAASSPEVLPDGAVDEARSPSSPPSSPAPPSLPSPTAPSSSVPSPTAPSATEPSSSSSSSSSVRLPAVGARMNELLTGADARGPRPSNRALGEALDFQPESEQDKLLGGGALAAARGTRRLQRDLAFDAVTVGLGDDWFRSVKSAAERAFQPDVRDLDNPGDVTRQKIAWNYLRDPSSWDDEAKAALQIFLEADRLSSKDATERLMPAENPSMGSVPTSSLRAATVDDLLRRKEAGLSVRFAFEVDVHHGNDGAVTTIDVLRTEFEKGLVEQVRLAVSRAVADAPPVPPRVANGGPFRSRWLFVATWYIDPPRPRLTSSNSLFAEDGAPALMFGATFDVGNDGLAVQNLDVKLKTTAELLEVTPLKR